MMPTKTSTVRHHFLFYGVFGIMVKLPLWWGCRCGEAAVMMRLPLWWGCRYCEAAVMVRLPLLWDCRYGEAAVMVKLPLWWGCRYCKVAITVRLSVWLSCRYGEAAVMVRLPLWCGCHYGEAAIIMRLPLWWGCHFFFSNYGLAWSRSVLTLPPHSQTCFEFWARFEARSSHSQLEPTKDWNPGSHGYKPSVLYHWAIPSSCTHTIS